MAVDLSQLPVERAARVSFLEAKIALYESIEIRGFRTNCGQSSLRMNKNTPENEFKDAMATLYERVINPYRAIDISKLPNRPEFSFVYSILDLMAHIDDCYQTYGSFDSSAGMREYAREFIRKDTLAIMTVADIWERNIRTYDRELKKYIMTDIQTVHQSILDAIREDGVLVAVPLYRRHKDEYERLPSQEAQRRWAELKEAMEARHQITPASLLMKGDPLFANGPSQTDYQLRQRMEVRQSPELTADIVGHIFEFYERGVGLVNKIDEIPTAPPIDPST